MSWFTELLQDYYDEELGAGEVAVLETAKHEIKQDRFYANDYTHYGTEEGK